MSSTDRDDTPTLFTDILLAVVAGLILIVFLLITHLNPVGSEETGDITQRGQLRIILTWPDDMRSDVDLWVEAPFDRPVGYSRKTGAIFSLFRDDLGHALDLGGANFEEAETRGLPPGEYVVNAHLFSNRAVLPIPVNLEVWTKPSREARAVRILRRIGELKFARHEITLVRFRIDDEGRLVSGSVHNRFKPLRAMKDRQ